MDENARPLKFKVAPFNQCTLETQEKLAGSRFCYGTRAYVASARNKEEIFGMNALGHIFKILPKEKSVEFHAQTFDSGILTVSVYSSIAVDPSGSFVIISHSMLLKVIKIPSWKPISLFKESDLPLRVSWISSLYFLIAHKSGKASLYSKKKKLKSLFLFPYLIFDFVFYLDEKSGNFQLIAAGESERLKRVDLASGNSIWSQEPLSGNGSWDYETAVLSKSKKMLVLGTDFRRKFIQIISVESGEEILSIRAWEITDGIHSILISPFSQRVVVLTGEEIVFMDFNEGNRSLKTKGKLLGKCSSGFVFWDPNKKEDFLVFFSKGVFWKLEVDE